MMETREAYYERVMPTPGITEVAHMQFHDALADFFKAVSEYSNTYVSDYMPQPHDWIYGCRNRPVSPSWARIPEAHYIQVDHKQNNWIYTWVCVPCKLDEKTRLGYELELLWEPEEIRQARAELENIPAYVTRFARGRNRIVERLKRGETVEVKVMSNGREFAIRPEKWEGIVLGFSCLIDGKVEPGYEGKMLSKDQLWDWTDQLIERA